ncbi:MAG TPA: MoaD/ThiS family protein [Actinomycetota bacterium]|nr:MoaD/ThiS family protein [Actinomycetota bacterium]
MQVTVQCFGAMREFLPADAEGREAELELDEAASAGDLIDRLGVPRRLVYALLVNDEPGNLDRKLHEGDKVTLMPQFTGGTRR